MEECTGGNQLKAELVATAGRMNGLHADWLAPVFTALRRLRLTESRSGIAPAAVGKEVTLRGRAPCTGAGALAA